MPITAALQHPKFLRCTNAKMDCEAHSSGEASIVESAAEVIMCIYSNTVLEKCSIMWGRIHNS
jgi:hypothetical protein